MKQAIKILLSTLRSPLMIGGVLSGLFYTAVSLRLINHPLIDEYFYGHSIEIVTTTLFLVGLASLLNKAAAAWWSWAFVARSQTALDHMLSTAAGSKEVAGLPVTSLASEQGGPDAPVIALMVEQEETDTGLDLPKCGNLVKQLDSEVAARPADKVTRRVRDVLDRMVRGGSVEHLDDELRYASEAEADRLYDEYALFRVVIWAVPILGFLGTVVGITMAIANLSPEAMEKSLPVVVSSLSVAFATTIQALSLSIVLMFAKYRVDLLETRLSAAVDTATERILLGRFQSFGDSPEGQLAAVRYMADTVVRSSEQLTRQQMTLSEKLLRQQVQATEEIARRQAELWQKSMEISEQRWAQVTATAGKQLETALVAAMSQSLKIHAEELAKNESLLASQNHEHLSHFTIGLQEAAQSAATLEESVERQVLVLQKTVEATGQVTRLEEALNRNLSALTNTKHLEQVSTSLAAAIQLLSGRLSDVSTCNIQLDSPEESSSAA